MAQITCSKCGQHKEAYEDNPFFGSALGQKIGSQVCKECFSEWEKMQTIVINEYHLNTAQAEHRKILVTKIKEFLNLKD